MKHTGIILLLCMVAAGCSSDDEAVENNDGRKLRQLTISEVPITRVTFADNTSSLDAIWDEKDEATYFNVSSFSSVTMDFGPLNAASSGRRSKFKGTVYCKTGDKVALLYPAKTPDTTSGDDRGKFTISLSGQKGTLEDIAKNFHYTYGEANVTSVTESTANATISEMQSLLAVCKFTFIDAASNLIPVETLTINFCSTSTDNPLGNPLGYPLSAMLNPFTKSLEYPKQNTWEATSLSVTPDNETSTVVTVVYVALFPYRFSDTDMQFSVTNSEGTYTGIAKATLKAGRYYSATLKLTKQ